ncbi:hypothetical protein Nepgr_019557 [Nepenthes gracilis]|uniref:Uncharacterized protein n=1 Tax=Nepenthes gracilis TaxID=150966 RepID=A0AAD3XVG5_NEPGR|nr:hypothetical protein Nepgr_019557 [Nepenthes gracilis]
MPSSVSWCRGALWMPVWCHADVTLLPGMDELRVRYAVCLADMEFCLFGGPAVLCFSQNAPIADLSKCRYIFCLDWIFANMQHIAVNAGMTCCIFSQYATLQQNVSMLMLC